MLENLVGENKALREHPDVVLYQNMILTRGDIATLATHTVRSQVWSYYSHAESSWTFFSGPVCFPVWMCAVSFWNHLSDMIHCLGYVTEDLNSRAYTPLSSILALFTLFDTSIECVRFKMVPYLHSWLLSFQALKGSVSVIAFGRLRERESGYSTVESVKYLPASAGKVQREDHVTSPSTSRSACSTTPITDITRSIGGRGRGRRDKKECSGYGQPDVYNLDLALAEVHWD